MVHKIQLNHSLLRYTMFRIMSFMDIIKIISNSSIIKSAQSKLSCRFTPKSFVHNKNVAMIKRIFILKKKKNTNRLPKP